MDVLQIGFGNGHLLPDLLGRAEGLNYVRIDISQTMIDEVRRFDASLVTSGQTTFHHAKAEETPFLAASFDRVFAVNVIYFWSDALRQLKEIGGVLRPNGFRLIAATLETTSANPVTRPEFGFLARDETTLVVLHEEAGFSDLTVELFEEAAAHL